MSAACARACGQVTDYAPRGGLAPLSAPHAAELLLSYTFVVSAALALLNAAPVAFLDGAAALDALLGLPGRQRVYI